MVLNASLYNWILDTSVSQDLGEHQGVPGLCV